jgi:hypothetical protein
MSRKVRELHAPRSLGAVPKQHVYTIRLSVYHQLRPRFEEGYKVEHSQKTAPFSTHDLVTCRQIVAVRDSVTAFSFDIRN